MALLNHSLIFEKGFNMIIKSIAREVGFIWIMLETNKLDLPKIKRRKKYSPPFFPEIFPAGPLTSLY